MERQTSCGLYFGIGVKVKWTPKTIALLFIKNLTGSGKWNKRYYIAQGYDIHPSAQINGYLDTQNPHLIHIKKNAVVSNAARIITHGPGVEEKPITIGEGAFIGTGAIILGKSIKAGELVPAGEVVR